jgi:hypothetical protein
LRLALPLAGGLLELLLKHVHLPLLLTVPVAEADIELFQLHPRDVVHATRVLQLSLQDLHMCFQGRTLGLKLLGSDQR